MKKIFLNFKFLLIIIVLILVIGIIYSTVFQKKSETLYVAFIGPMSGEGSAAGKLMSQAIQLYFDEVNQNKELGDTQIELQIFDDQNDCEPDKKTGQKAIAEQQAQRIVEENKVIAVIGHWYSGCSIAGGQVYKKYGFPAITPGSTNIQVTEGNEWYFRNIYNASASGQFLAHYVKKVFHLNQVTIIQDGSGYGSYLAQIFERTAQKIELNVHQKWSFDKTLQKWSTHSQQQLTATELIQALKNSQQDAGAILLAVQAGKAVELVQKIKEAQIKNYILGGSSLSEDTFQNGFNQFPREKANEGFYTNDIYVATPLIFDTANEQAQRFKENYQAQYHQEPDWSAAYAYDSAKVIVEAIRRAKIKEGTQSLQAHRKKIRETLARLTNIHEAVKGTTGFNYFDKNRDAKKPVVIGVYKNRKLISALTQFQVVRNANEIADLERALQEERVLKIGDQYMYKTNVVYVGIKPNEINKIHLDDLTYVLDTYLWFRFQGDFDPKQIEFLNIVDSDNYQKEDKLSCQLLPENPKSDQSRAFVADDTKSKKITYQLYRIKCRFRIDFLSDHYVYKQHTLGIHFHHKNLTRNNLIYVTDVLGMGKTDSVLKEIEDNKVINPTEGWIANQIRFFQDVARKYSLGNPEYLNIQGGTVEYSRFNAGIVIKKNEFSLRGRIPLQYAPHLAILSITLIFLFQMLATKFKISQLIWFIHVFLAGLLLLSGEVLLVRWLSETFSTYYSMKIIIRIFDILWWLIPAFLFSIAAEIFIWTPLEEKSGRLIPNIVRLFLAFIIYFIALVGVVAFVYERPLTSILATSGVIAMIIGLAIQINISNIFSGIAINIERPFRIGDWVQIGQHEEGEIVDITWRTTRIKTRGDCILSIPNSMASESPITNFCYPDDNYWLWPTVYVHPMHPPARVRKLLLDALLSADKVLKDPKPVVLFTGINEWAASYWIAFCADNYAQKYFILEDVWTRVWFHLNRAGIAPAVQRQELHLFKGIKERGGEEATKPITLLQEVEVFKPFSEEAKHYLSQKIRRQRINEGDIIVKQGDIGDSLFIIVEGVVSVQVSENGRTKEVNRLGAGDIFGEMALLTGEQRMATVTALVDTFLFELRKEDIAPLMAKEREVSELVSKVLAHRQFMTRTQMHVQHDVEQEKETLRQRFLNKIESFFGLDK